MTDIGKRLREIRKQRGFPQKLIAQVLGVHRPNYSRIEGNKQSITAEQLQLFCDYCKASADYILGIPTDKTVLSKEKLEDIIRRINELKDALKE